MKIYKQFYMIFVLMRACLWTVSDSFAGTSNANVTADHIIRDEEANDDDLISLADRRMLYVSNENASQQNDFSGTPVSHITAMPVLHRDKVYKRKNLSGGRARFLRLLLFPNHSFG